MPVTPPCPRSGLEHRLLLVEFERIVFTNRAERDDTGNAVIDQIVNHALRIGEIDRQILSQLSRNRRKNTLPANRHHTKVPYS